MPDSARPAPRSRSWPAPAHPPRADRRPRRRPWRRRPTTSRWPPRRRRAAKASAIALPIPEAPPVTMATAAGKKPFAHRRLPLPIFTPISSATTRYHNKPRNCAKDWRSAATKSSMTGKKYGSSTNQMQSRRLRDGVLKSGKLSFRARARISESLSHLQRHGRA